MKGILRNAYVFALTAQAIVMRVEKTQVKKKRKFAGKRYI